MWCEKRNIQWVSRQELRDAAREKWEMIQEDLSKQFDDEAAPEPIIRIPTRINDKDETYIINVGGWGAA